MKKLFYFATVLLSISLFSCSSDDDKEVVTSEGYVVKEVSVTSEGTQSKPLAGGKELTVTGSFATNSDIYIRPYTATRAEVEMDKNAVKLEVADRTTGSLKIKTPFLYGKYELLEKEGTKIYTLGAVYFKDAKVLAKVDGSGIIITFEYDESNRLKTIKNTDQDGSVPRTISFSYDSKGDLSKVETTGEDERILNITQADGSITINGKLWGEEFTSTLTFNSQGQVIKQVQKKETSSEIGGEIEIFKHEVVSDYSYDNKGNLIKNVTVKTVNGEKDNFGSGTNEYKYDDSKSFFSNQLSLPSWYWVYDGSYTLRTLTVGLTNNCIEVKAPGMIPGSSQTTEYSFEYDSDLYPIKIFTNDIKEASHIITYK